MVTAYTSKSVSFLIAHATFAMRFGVFGDHIELVGSEEKHSFEVELERKPGDEKQAGPLELG